MILGISSLQDNNAFIGKTNLKTFTNSVTYSHCFHHDLNNKKYKIVFQKIDYPGICHISSTAKYVLQNTEYTLFSKEQLEGDESILSLQIIELLTVIVAPRYSM